ncbi:MAG: hypothetical protein KDG50_13500 [Chromatiales bacterium]|nr:hypothetical protein [Chromatiales bacterium]
MNAGWVAAFALWPLAGVVVTALVNQFYRRRHGCELVGPPPAPIDILIRMYLWPLLIIAAWWVRRGR